MNKPQKITDLVDNIDFYIEQMREERPEETMEITNFLENYAKEAVESLEQDDAENKKLIIKITDTLYKKAMDFTLLDIYTNGYIAIVLNRLYLELGQKKIRIFYILDNSLRDDNLRLLLEQFPPAGFAVIAPHIGNKLEYKPITTQTENLPYEKVEKKINDALKLGKNIFYIERDRSVNYLDKVVELARNASNEYAKVFRNTTIDNSEITKIEQIEKINYKKNEYLEYKKYQSVGDWWKNEGRGKFTIHIPQAISNLQKKKNLSFHEAFEHLVKIKAIIFVDEEATDK